jgi:hypothetical protein
MTYDPSKFRPVSFEGQGWVNAVWLGADELGVPQEETEGVLASSFYTELGVDRVRVESYTPTLVVDETNAEFVHAAAEAVLAVDGIRGALLWALRDKKIAERLITDLNLSNFREWRAAATVAAWPSAAAS